MICPFRNYEIKTTIFTPMSAVKEEDEEEESNVMVEELYFNSKETTVRSYYDCLLEDCACWIDNHCVRK